MAGVESLSHSPSATLSQFPHNPEDFDGDPRVSFSKLAHKFILEADNGEEFEFDDALKRWVPVLDDALMEQQRAAYAVEGVDEAEPAQAGKKRKKQVHTNGEDETGGRLNTKKAKPAPEPRERKNTAIYVTSLPLDATVQEVHDVFSRCGVIAEEIDRGKPRIKLYTDDDGDFKGDALILYFRAESVDLAIQLLDDTEFRLGNGQKMKVAAADFSYKAQKDAPAKSNMKDKKKIMKKTQKLNNKLADWDDDDPQALQETSSRWDKVAILKHLFTLKELEEDPAAILDIKEDIREECAKLGEVTNVVLFDKEVDGVASVRFANAIAASECVKVMNGRHFAGMVVEAYIADGNEKFKKSSEKRAAALADDGEEGHEEEGRRLDQFGSWLEEDAGAAGD
ncbi:splicing factor U2AF-associated protein [Usnea florida]